MDAEIDRIADQIRRSWSGEAWHGPSVREALAGVDAATASARPIADSHTIAELSAHLDFANRIVLERIAGRGYVADDAGWWPPVAEPLTDAAWADLLGDLELGAATLDATVAAFPADRLTRPLGESGSTAYDNFLGHAQHNAYHAGQIQLLKKLISRRPS